MGKYRGGAEAKSSEPLQFIIKKFMKYPGIAWKSVLKEAAQSRMPVLYVI